MEGRKALITGSTSGIGLAIAQLLASKGCDVILTGSGKRPLAETDALKQQFTSKYKNRCDYIGADFTKPEEVEKLCKDVDELCPGGIDILINNAGTQHMDPVDEFPLDKWQDLIQAMLTTPFILIKHFLPAMKQKGFGRIINISSVWGVVATPFKSAYCAAKFGLNGLTKVVALETGGTGVTCNAIGPGYVDTPMTQWQIEEKANERGLTFKDVQKEFLETFHPSKAAVETDHIAEMCLFLCSEAGSQMTGTCVMMDGGWTAR